MADLIPIDINWAGMGGVGSTIAFWVGWSLVGVVLLGAMFTVYYMMQFTIKAEIFQLFGSGKDGVFSFAKPKKNRFKWIKKRSAWRPLFPLFNKKEVEPFDSEYIYPGKKVYAFELNDNIIPGRVNINKTEEELRCEINPVPYYVRNWQSLQHKKNAIEYAEHNFWQDNKMLIMGVICVGICCVLCGATIYFTYKFAGGGAEGMNTLANAIKGFGNIPGQAPS